MFQKSIASIFFLLPFGSLHADEPYDVGRLEKEVIVTGCEDATGMQLLPDGRILFVERAGGVKLFVPATNKTIRLASLPTATFGDAGLLCCAADPNFTSNGWIYLLHCPADDFRTMRVTRFTLTGDSLDLKSAKAILKVRIDAPEAGNHLGGGLAFDRRGDLYVGMGDNSPPIPELPIDQRKGHEVHDSLRSAANSMDLRGKILRIHPNPDGTYSTPADNLFPDGKEGRPEIYAMGCRNPFRVFVDDRTGWVYWADVGQNVIPDIKIGPNGYDEVNQAKKPGNFGWPMFTGPNEPYRNFDFATRKAGEFFDVEHPKNLSKNNTGLKDLPPPQPALIWYSTAASKQFPELGDGGRSIVVGPVYYADAARDSNLRLPDRFNGTLFISEWMRNWIKAVKLTSEGKVERIDDFAPAMQFRRPIDMHVGPEGALYVIEYGERWDHNRDGQIVRLVYRRGNRPPIAKLSATPTAGRHPLKVQLDGSKSFDRDEGEKLSYRWRVDGKDVADASPATSVVFDKPGLHRVELIVKDAAGVSNSTRAEIRVGNAAPVVRVLEPRNGGFYEMGQPFTWKTSVEDAEDGNTEKGTLPLDRPTIRIEARPRLLGAENADPGLALMRKSSCFSCHTADSQSKGPPYQTVAQKYRTDRNARETLAKKIVNGGVGVWGAYPMPPHPQHTLEQTRLMADWVLGLVNSPAPYTRSGVDGGYLPSGDRIGAAYGGVLLVTGSYTDQGASGASPLTGEATVALHSRRTRAVFHDSANGAQVMDDLEGEHGPVVRLGNGDSILFHDFDLTGIEAVTARVGMVGGGSGTLELHADSPTGPLLATFKADGRVREIRSNVVDPSGLHSLCLVSKSTEPPAKKLMSLTWIEFHDSAAASEARGAVRREARKKIAAATATETATRKFRRAYTVEEILPELKRLDSGRSAEKGKRLFQSLGCNSCHRMNGEGGQLGPELTDLVARLGKKETNVRAAIVREIVEPSRVIDSKYRTRLIETVDGERLAGIVVSENDDEIKVAANAARPNEIRTIQRTQIENMRTSDVSLMPTGLLNVLTMDEILDLIAYLEKGK